MDLEPSVPLVDDGTIVNIVVNSQFTSPGFSVVKTCIHQDLVYTDLKLKQGGKITLFGVRKQTFSGRSWLLRTAETLVMEHSPIDVTNFKESIELCTGIGAVTTGYEQCGVQTTTCNEQNHVFAEWLRKRGKRVVEGDISDPKVIAKVALTCGGITGIMSGGVSCQPWSVLGDQKAFMDERSKSLPGALMAIHLMQMPLAILECTPKVFESEEAQNMFRRFSQLTGRVIQQKLLNLHTFWPCRRQRWWATISHPSLNVQPIPDIPPLVFQPSLLHLMPFFMDLKGDELQSLRLDDFEMEQFLTTKKGMREHQVDNWKALPTATHSWGSQLRGCECKCRTKGFSQHRIENKGLYAQLIPLNEQYASEQSLVNRMRHMHACEVALANGLNPFFEGFQKMSPRLALAGVGQLATPFQGAWVLSNALKDIQHMGLPIDLPAHPIEIMKNMALSLLRNRDELLGNPTKTELMLRFEMAISLWGNPDARELMKSFSMPEKTESTEVVQNSGSTLMPSCPGSVPMPNRPGPTDDYCKSVSTSETCASEAEPEAKPSQPGSVPILPNASAPHDKPSLQESVPVNGIGSHSVEVPHNISSTPEFPGSMRPKEMQFAGRTQIEMPGTLTSFSMPEKIRPTEVVQNSGSTRMPSCPGSVPMPNRPGPTDDKPSDCKSVSTSETCAGEAEPEAKPSRPGSVPILPNASAPHDKPSLQESVPVNGIGSHSVEVPHNISSTPEFPGSMRPKEMQFAGRTQIEMPGTLTSFSMPEKIRPTDAVQNSGSTRMPSCPGSVPMPNRPGPTDDRPSYCKSVSTSETCASEADPEAKPSRPGSVPILPNASAPHDKPSLQESVPVNGISSPSVEVPHNISSTPDFPGSMRPKEMQFAGRTQIEMPGTSNSFSMPEKIRPTEVVQNSGSTRMPSCPGSVPMPNRPGPTDDKPSDCKSVSTSETCASEADPEAKPSRPGSVPILPNASAPHDKPSPQESVPVNGISSPSVEVPHNISSTPEFPGSMRPKEMQFAGRTQIEMPGTLNSFSMPEKIRPTEVVQNSGSTRMPSCPGSVPMPNRPGPTDDCKSVSTSETCASEAEPEAKPSRPGSVPILPNASAPHDKPSLQESVPVNGIGSPSVEFPHSISSTPEFPGSMHPKEMQFAGRTRIEMPGTSNSFSMPEKIRPTEVVQNSGSTRMPSCPGSVPMPNRPGPTDDKPSHCKSVSTSETCASEAEPEAKPSRPGSVPILPNASAPQGKPSLQESVPVNVIGSPSEFPHNISPTLDFPGSMRPKEMHFAGRTQIEMPRKLVKPSSKPVGSQRAEQPPTTEVAYADVIASGYGPPQVNPPACLLAMPLPRLGCGGPTPGKSDEEQVTGIYDQPKHVKPSSRFCPPNEAPKVACSMPQNLDSTSEDLMPACGTHVPPTPFQAMPLPRLGCGGPSPKMSFIGQEEEPTINTMSSQEFLHVGQCHTRPFNADRTKALHDMSGTTDGPVAADVDLPKHSIEGSLNMSEEKPLQDVESPVSGSFVHASETHAPKPLQAMPLPRLGCGGPSHADASEELRTQHQPDRDGQPQSHICKTIQSGATTPWNPSEEADDEEAFAAAMLQVCQQAEADTENFRTGAVPGFSTGSKRVSAPEPDPPSKKLKTSDAESPADLPKDTVPPSARADPLQEHDHSGDEELIEVFVIADNAKPMSVRIPWGQTAGQLVVAHAKLTGQTATDLAINSVMATQVSLTCVLSPGMVVKIDHVKHISRVPCQVNLDADQKKIPVLMHDTREILLWQQQGWTAVDEMQFYMQMTGNSYPGKFMPPRVVPATDSRALAKAVLDVVDTVMKTHQPVAFLPIMSEHHWFPMAAMPYEDKVAVWTVSEVRQRLIDAIIATAGIPPFEIFTSPFPSNFPADCGFQTVGWMITLASFDGEMNAITADQAAHWRQLFHAHLQATDQHQTWVHKPLIVGGAMSSLDALVQLIIDHGVAESRSKECADMIMTQLGSSTVQRILNSPRPWPDLKARASLCKPPLRIVLPEELQHMLKSKLERNQPVGRKNNKMKSKPMTADIRLKPDQIVVPKAVFKQQDGVELGNSSQTK